MSARYPPPARDRSPPRYDRRPSNTYANLGSSYRGTADPPPSSVDRPPPRGPKADSFRGGYQFSPSARGRGGAPFARGPSDSWDRERERERDRDRDRDVRPPPQSYRSRDEERSEWARRDRDPAQNDRPIVPPRDSRSYTGRDRSASPVRARRDSRESIPPLQSRATDSASTFYGSGVRGGLSRGRGRGDWDRARGRSSFAGDRDRDLFAVPRSRSREGWRDRDVERGRTAAADDTRGDRFDRRDHERTREQDSARRDHDPWQREVSPGRATTVSSIARPASPAQSASTNAPLYGADRSSKMDYEMGRRPSAAITPGSSGRDGRRESDQADYFGVSSRRDGPAQLSQPSPASTGGLDYGPPPSIPSTTPAAGDKATPSKPQSTKQEASVPQKSTFQPPSGPKADRPQNTTTNILTPKAPQAYATDAFKLSRPTQSLVPSGTALGDPRTESRTTTGPTLDKTMPVNVPSGPRSSLGLNVKPRQLQSDSTSSILPQNKPPDNRSLSIPTGPRSERETNWSAPGNATRSWISPDYNRTKPSIMNPINRDRPSFAPTGPRSQSLLHQQPRIIPPNMQSSAGPSPTSASLIRKPAMTGQHRPPTGPTGSEDVEMSLPASSDEDGDEDEFDEDDFAASEAKYLQERKALEAKKPPPLLQDSSVRHLLIRIQFLHMILHDVIPQNAQDHLSQDEKPKESGMPHIGLPSPPEQSAEEEATKPELKHPIPRGRPLSQPPVNPIPTPPLDELPFLSKGSPKLTVFDEPDDEVQHEAVTTLIRQEFERAAFDWRDELGDMRTEFKKMYPVWKAEIGQLELDRRELQASPAPASPAPSAAPSVTPSLGHERTRGARNTTEADLQAAILMSQQSLKEEEERREREAASSSQPNYDTEAVVPAMLKPKEVDFALFEDTNRIIPSKIALDVFAFVPPEDDFTEEEQLAFIAAYCQNPKKWGKIAESLENRSYQDCIAHYYLTKNEANYKEIFRRSQPKRKRGRAATKPRSTALMSELVYGGGEDADPAVAVTDTGRPRRAAAPTFGENQTDGELATQAPQSKRLAMAKEIGADPAAPKPTRGRKAGAPAKPRRTKNQMHQAEQAALLPAGTTTDISPSKPTITPRAERTRTILRAENGIAKGDVMSAVATHGAGDADMAQYSAAETERLGPTPNVSTGAQATSYWSVPEVQKFPQLIAYYGRDFTAIAEFMKTKTVTMIKNYYNRQIHDGKTDLEELAKIAETRRMQGDPIGPPPSPAAQTKRRYEATPSTATVSRPGIPHTEVNLAEPESNAVQPKTGYTEDFPSNVVQRSVTGDLVAKPKQSREVLREVQTISSPSKADDSAKSSVFSQNRQGAPASGIFKEEHSPFGLTRSVPHNLSLQEQSPHLHPHRPGDLRATEIRQQPLASSPKMPALQHSREGISLSAHPTMQMGVPHAHAREDRFSSLGHQPLHGRSGSSGGTSHLLPEQTKDMSFLRRPDVATTRTSPYASIAAQSSLATLSHPLAFGRPESVPAAQSAPSDVPKPAPPKRSTIMSILNDDPPATQPEKRSSQDSQNRSSFLSPRTSSLDGSANAFDSRSGLRQDESSLFGRNPHAPLGHSISGPNGPQVLRDPHHPLGLGQPVQNTEKWMDRFDPRPEQRTLHQSPRHVYSVAPPPSNPSGSLTSLPGLRNEASRVTDPGHPDHRRSLLGQINHPGSNPSPPPQQGPQSIQPYRSLSGSSQHGRVSSLGLSLGQSPSQHPHQSHQPSGPSSHPQSASSTPAPTLQHQNRSFIEPSPSQRLTIQQHMAQQQQSQPDPRRDHEISLRAREHEAQQERRRAEEREHEAHRRRDMIGHGPGREPQQQSSSFLSNLPGQLHMYGHQPQEPLSRTYTATPPSYVNSSNTPQGPNGPYLGHQQQQQVQGLGLGAGSHHSTSHSHGHGHGHGGAGHFRGFSQDGGRDERR